MDFGKIGEELFGDISEKFDNFCSEVDEAINSKLVAVGAHIKGFWSEILQDTIPKSPENFIDVEEEEVAKISDSRKAPAILDDKKYNINLCPISELNFKVPDDHLQRESFLEEDAAMRMYNSSHVGNKENGIHKVEISFLGSFESIFGSCGEWETSRHVDTNTEVASDQQADVSVASSMSTRAKLSDGGVRSDEYLSMLSLGKSDVSGTEDVMDLENYPEVDGISHLEWSTVGANGPLLTEEFMHTTQSELAKPELYEDYYWVNASKLSPIPGLEKNNGKSKMKSMEAKENEHLENQEQERSFAPTMPKAHLNPRDDKFPEDDWVVL